MDVRQQAHKHNHDKGHVLDILHWPLEVSGDTIELVIVADGILAQAVIEVRYHANVPQAGVGSRQSQPDNQVHDDDCWRGNAPVTSTPVHGDDLCDVPEKSEKAATSQVTAEAMGGQGPPSQ